MLRFSTALTLNFINHRIAARADAVDFRLNLTRFDEIVSHIHATGRDQHRSPDGDATGNRQTVDRESQLLALTKLVGNQCQQGVHGLLLAATIGF